MEHLLQLHFESTCYLVFRQPEWAFFLRVADGGSDGIHIDIDFTYRESPDTLNPRRFTLPVGEGMSLDMERVDGTEESITIWPDSVDGDVVTLGIEVPGGVTVQPFNDSDAEAG